MAKKKWEYFTKKELKEIVKSSKSYREILRKIGYGECSHNNKYVREFCEKFQIDYSHLSQGKKEDLTGQIFG